MPTLRRIFSHLTRDYSPRVGAATAKHHDTQPERRACADPGDEPPGPGSDRPDPARYL